MSQATTTCTGLVAQQILNAFLGEALLPAPHHRPAHADPLGNSTGRCSADIRMICAR
jgi:hypothetical protein